jgi:hypothetical protein
MLIQQEGELIHSLPNGGIEESFLGTLLASLGANGTSFCVLSTHLQGELECDPFRQWPKLQSHDNGTWQFI